MIEAVKLEKGIEFDFNRKVRSEEEQKEKVIESATLEKFNSNNIPASIEEVNVENIYNDDGMIIIKTENKLIRISRDLIKQLVYDIYLK